MDQTLPRKNSRQATYEGVGSGEGIEKIKKKVIDFGSSDKPLDPNDLKTDDLIQFSIIMGGVVIVVNLKEVTQPLKLSGEVLTKIFLGKITKWGR